MSVIPADRHSCVFEPLNLFISSNRIFSPTKLLNYLTAPDTVIWSALLASAAVPGILNPVVLMQKLKDGSVVPWNWGSKFKDGSLRVDIPIQSLNLYFNGWSLVNLCLMLILMSSVVTHPVVSQVNPHVHLFFFAPRGSAGKPVATRKSKGWRGNFLLSAAEQWLKLELTKNFKVITTSSLRDAVVDFVTRSFVILTCFRRFWVKTGRASSSNALTALSRRSFKQFHEGNRLKVPLIPESGLVLDSG